MPNEHDHLQDWIARWWPVSHTPSREELDTFVRHILQEERARMVKILEEFLESMEHHTDEMRDVVAMEHLKHFFSDMIRRLTQL